jgi:hypothetical protein
LEGRRYMLAARYGRQQPGITVSEEHGDVRY